MPKKGRDKKNDPKKAAKLAAKRAAVEAERAMTAALKAAKANADPLAALPAAFLAYNRNGLQCSFEHHTPESITKSSMTALHRMLEGDKLGLSGLAEDDCRLMLVRAGT